MRQPVPIICSSPNDMGGAGVAKASCGWRPATWLGSGPAWSAPGMWAFIWRAGQRESHAAATRDARSAPHLEGPEGESATST